MRSPTSLRRRPAAALLALALPACLSTSSPPPAVRYFDPSTHKEDVAQRSAVACDLRVTAPSHLGREFVVRVGEHEVVFDGLNSWVADPRELVQVAVERLLGPSVRSPDSRAMAIDVEVFELDLQGAPQAHVRLAVQAVAGSRTFDLVVPAADRQPASFAAAMAQALDQAAALVSELHGAPIPAPATDR